MTTKITDKPTYADRITSEYIAKFNEPPPDDLDKLIAEENGTVRGRLRGLGWEVDLKHNIAELCGVTGLTRQEALLVYIVQSLDTIQGHLAVTAGAIDYLARVQLRIQQAQQQQDEE